MTKIQKQKHINTIMDIIKSIPNIEESRFGNFKFKEKGISFYPKDNNLRIELKEHCIFSKPWIRITIEDIQKIINKYIK